MQQEDSTNLNKIHGSFVEIFKVTAADTLHNDVRAKIIDSIMALKVNALLCRFPIDNDMMLICQISRVDGNLLNPASNISVYLDSGDLPYP